MAYINKIVVNGQEVNANQLEGILDKDGHNRFIEGSVELTSAFEGTNLTVEYNKWALSGTHLMLVFQITNNTESDITIPAWTIIGNPNFPSWILDKIYVIGGTTPSDLGNVVITKTVGYGTGLEESTNTLFAYFEKAANGIRLKAWSTADDTNNVEVGRHYRIQFDLVIDNA